MLFQRKIFEYCKKIEGACSRLQGKGYVADLGRELELTMQPLKVTPTLAVDIGGNLGDYTYELKQINPLMEVHTFEPSKVNVDKLNNRFTADQIVTIVPYALSDFSGVTTLFSDEDGSGMASLTKRKLDHHKISFSNTEKITTVRFDDYWEKTLNRREIDLVKIDVEGHELPVLRGFGDALFVTKVIQFEFGGTCIDTRTFFQDYWYFFLDKNFKIFRITPLGLLEIENYLERDEVFYYMNYVAVNQRYL